jgi:polysaccharide chain length determinant protein (PEP-CTERM system associated)
MFELDAAEPTGPGTTGGLRQHLEAPIRRPWVVVVPWLLVVAAAVAASVFLPKRYVSSTAILVEGDKVPDAFVQRTTTEGTRRLQTVQQEVLSRTRLEKVIQELNPYPRIADQPMSAIVEKMRDAISVKVRGNDGFSIEFQHTDPEMAMKVANRLTSLFIDESSRARERHAEEASRFIEVQLEDARSGLQVKEEALRRFKEQHIGTLPEQLQANLSTLQRLQMEQQALSLNLQSALDRLRTLESAAATHTPEPGGEVPELDRLRVELAALRARYTDAHPDVQTLLSRIARLEQATNPQSADPSSAATDSSSLRAARQEVRTLRTRQADIAARVASFEARVDQTPRTEQELTTLTRDYNTLRENYLTLLNKKMSARMAEQLEKQWTGDRFRILDPAQVPESPVFPKPTLFLVVGLFAGLALGLASAVTVEALDRSVKTAAELESLLEQPVLASVSHIAPGVVGPRRSVDVALPVPAQVPRARTVVSHAESAPPAGASVVVPEFAESLPAATAPVPAPTVSAPAPRITAPPAPAAVQVPVPVPAPVPVAVAVPAVHPGADLESPPPPPRAEPSPGPFPSSHPQVAASAGDLWQDLLSGGAGATAPSAAGAAIPSPGLPAEAPAAPSQAPATYREMRPRSVPAVAYSPGPVDAPAGTPADVIRLVVDGGSLHGLALEMDANAERTLGTAPGCDLRLDFGNVDAVHARVVSHRRGLQISDLGSARGTYVNGRRIQGDHPLRDGDAVFLGPPGSRQSAKLVVEGAAAAPVSGATASVPAVASPVRFTATPARASTVSAPAAEPAATLPRVRPARRRTVSRSIVAAGVAVASLAGATAYTIRRAKPPSLTGLNPVEAEAGQTVQLSGEGFDARPRENIVRFGESAGVVTSAGPHALAVTVPAVEGPREVPVTVETRGRRSKPAILRIAAPARLTAVQPQVVQPGQEVVLTGRNLSREPRTVYVGGASVEILEASAGSLRFRMPADLRLAEGTTVPVSVKVGEEVTAPLSVILGHLPIITALAPARGPAGERVVITGHGFDPRPEGNLVSFGGRPALVFSASATQLTVAAPSPGTAAGQFPSDVIVQAGGSTSAGPAVYTLVRPPSQVFVPRFFPAPAPATGHAGHDHASVATELGPVLLLTGSVGEVSSAERAARVATMMNALVESSAKPLALALRDGTPPAVVLMGGAEVLAVATPADASGYEERGEGGPGSAPASPRTVAAYWTALLQDHLALFVQGERPTRVLALSARGQVLTDLYAEALRRTGPRSGVPAALVTPLVPSLAEGLRNMALGLPADDQPTVAAAVIGRWQGTMEEGETGRLPIVVRFALKGTRLNGVLGMTSRTPGIQLDTLLQDLVYSRGSVSFKMGVGKKVLHFQGTVQDDSISGPVYGGAQGRDPVGFFSLHYVQ